MNTYRAIVTFNSCADNDSPADGIPDWSGMDCSNAPGSTEASWKAADLIDSVATKAYATTVAPDEIPLCNDNSVATFVSSQATRQWRDLSDDPRDGQYRLVDYQFLENDPDDVADNAGKLVVQGRFRQQGTGANATESAGTANSKMEVTFPIERETAGMWISDHQRLEVPNTGTNGWPHPRLRAVLRLVSFKTARPPILTNSEIFKLVEKNISACHENHFLICLSAVTYRHLLGLMVTGFWMKRFTCQILVIRSTILFGLLRPVQLVHRF